MAAPPNVPITAPIAPRTKPGHIAPLGVPIGAELLGLDFSEDKLLSYAYVLEQAANPRKAPLSTPRLPGASFSQCKPA